MLTPHISIDFFSITIDVFSVSNAVENYILLDDVIAYPVGPYFETLPADPLALKLFNLWRRPEGVYLQPFERLQHLLLNRWWQ